jgi:serine/threonine protein kinase
MIGRTVSHYRIEEKLGSGGMGEVFLAEDTSLRRKVAVKFLSLEKQPDQTAHHRIIREARSAAGLEHSNICTIHEIGTVDGKDFIVMEYVDGQTLRDRLAKGPIPPDLALRIVSDVAEALEEAHENGIIHKDLKPENIMITRRGQTKILDFGLAMKMISKEAIESSADTLSTSVWGQEGGGTLSYMSPEQLLGESIDIRSDLFSLGIVFYEMLARNNPFKAANSVATCDRILHEEPKPIHQIAPEVPEDIGKLITQMLAKNPDDRPASARELLASLRELMRSEQIA